MKVQPRERQCDEVRKNGDGKDGDGCSEHEDARADDAGETAAQRATGDSDDTDEEGAEEGKGKRLALAGTHPD